MSDLKNIYRITRHFGELQGFKSIAVGFFIILAWVNGLGQARSGNMNLLVAEFLILIAIYPGIERHYKERYGSIKRRKTWVEIAAYVVIIGIVMLADWIDVKLVLPISLTGIAIAGVCLINWQLTGRFRNHLLALALFSAAVGLWPLLVSGNVAHWSLSQGDGILLLGFVGIVGGIMDHMMLAKAFPLVEESVE